MSTDKFDNIPKIVLDREDREAFHGRNVKPSKGADVALDYEPTVAKSSGGVWGVLAFFMVLGAFGASYFLYDLSLKQQQMLADSEDRIYELERKLSATGEELDQSAVALRVQVNELKDKTEVLWQEMDKLWASAWRRNQSEIKDLESKVSKDFQAQKKLISGLESDVSLSTTNMAVLQEQVDTQLNKAQQLTSSIESVVLTSATTQEDVQDMTDQLATAALRIEALVERVNSLEELKTQLENAQRRAATQANQLKPEPVVAETATTTGGGTTPVGG